MFNVRPDTIREMSTNGPTYMKGRSYYKNNQVTHIEYDRDKNTIQALVSGSQTYNVRIILTAAGQIHDATCTCSAFASYWGYCRHIVAALLYSAEHFGPQIRKTSRNTGKSSTQGHEPELKFSDKTAEKQKISRKAQNLKKNQPVKTAATPVTVAVTEAKSNKSAATTPEPRQQPVSDNQRKIRAKSREFKHQLDRVVQLHSSKPRRQLQLQVILHVSPSSGTLPWLTFAIGEDRLYPVGNVEQFAEALALNQTLEIDRGWSYNPVLHRFSPEDHQLIELITDAFENDYKAVFATSHTAGRDKYLVLNASRFAQFLKMAPDLANAAWLPAKADNIRPIRVKQTDLPLMLKLEEFKDSNYLSLEIACGCKMQQITPSRNVFLVDDVFYLPPREHISLIEPLLTVYQAPGLQQILLTPSEAGDLLGQVMPLIETFCAMKISEEIKNRIISDPLTITAALDLGTQGIRADVAYQYGSVAISPCKPETAAVDQLVIRDYEQEHFFEDTLKQMGFQPRGSLMLLDNNQQIFEYLDHGRTKLRTRAIVSESSELEKIQVHQPPRIRFDLNMEADSSSLQLIADWGDLEQSELADYHQALVDSRTWYQSRKGHFRKVSLNERKSLIEVYRLFESWDIIDRSYEEKQLILPHYRAMALSAITSQILRIDETVHDMVAHLSDPARLSFRLPSGIKTTLRPYQRHGFQWLCTLHTYRLGGILADDMGLGKTLQTIAFVTWLSRRTRRPTLIIAPTSLTYNWLSEFNRFVPDLPVMILDGSRQQRSQRISELNKYACIITSYALMRRDIDDLSEIQFASCFLDEAQNIKNPDTLNARSVKQIKCDCSFALTGTPVENSLTELWSIFDFIMPGYLLSHRHFQNNYEIPIQQEQNNELLEQLHELIKPFILRRMKKDVLKELPDKIETSAISDMTLQQRKIYESFLRQAGRDLENELEGSGYSHSHIFILALLTRLRQICCHPSLFISDYEGGSGKLELLSDLLEESISSGHRVLVFSQFTNMLDIISRHWTQSGHEKPFYIDGQVAAEERLRLVERFNGGENNLFLISLRAGGTGLNLTGADTVIHYDPWWNPAVEDQATDRAYRIGQENVVQVIKLYARDSIEERIMKLQQQKKNLMDAVIKPGQNLLSKMSIEEVKSLFDI